MSDIRRLARQYGIADHYYDYRGERKEVAESVQGQLLQALGADFRTVSSESGKLSADQDHELMAATVVARGPDVNVMLRPVPMEAAGRLRWRLDLEEGWTRHGELAAGPASAAQVDETGRIRVALKLNGVPLGYHQLRVETSGRCVSSRLIVVPERCHQPAAIKAGRRLWGLSIQLYSLRSRRNWGIGDFGDLRRLAVRSASLGVDFIGLNPLHALSLTDPQQASPYSPSSRVFLHPLYIDVTAVPGFNNSTRLNKLLSREQFQAKLKQLRSEPRQEE